MTGESGMWKKITDAGIVLCAAALAVYVAVEMTDLRSEERRVGKECRL